VGFFLTTLKQEALVRVVGCKGRAKAQDIPENLEEKETCYSSVVWK